LNASIPRGVKALEGSGGRGSSRANAIKLHIEGTISVRLRVSSTGAVQVLGVTSDLGHGLGDSAVRAVQATRFQPATDESGHPIDWEGVVNVAFQLAG